MKPNEQRSKPALPPKPVLQRSASSPMFKQPINHNNVHRTTASPADSKAAPLTPQYNSKQSHNTTSSDTPNYRSAFPPPLPPLPDTTNHLQFSGRISPRPSLPSRANRPQLPAIEYEEEEVAGEGYEEPKEEDFLAPGRWLGGQRLTPATVSENTVHMDKMTKEQRTRYLAIEELVSTEKLYYDDLTIAIQAFLVPIRAESKLEETKIANIFGNIEMLQQISGQFYELLNQRITRDSHSWDTAIGDIFCQKSAEFFLYKTYCANHPVANETVQALLAKNPVFSKLVAKCMENPICKNANFGLTDYLIKPVQRLCKYPLLIKQVLDNTPETHHDHKNLVLAKEKIAILCEQVNAYCREVENTLRLLQIKTHVADCQDVVAPTRRFIKEGIFVSYNSSNHPRQLVAFLLNDLLLLSKPKNKNYLDESKRTPACLTLKHRIVLRDAVLKNLLPHTNTDPTQVDFDGGKFVILKAGSLEQKNMWMGLIADLIRKQQPTRAAAIGRNVKLGSMTPLLGLSTSLNNLPLPPRLNDTSPARPIVPSRSHLQRPTGVHSEPSSPRNEGEDDHKPLSPKHAATTETITIPNKAASMLNTSRGGRTLYTPQRTLSEQSISEQASGMRREQLMMRHTVADRPIPPHPHLPSSPPIGAKSPSSELRPRASLIGVRGGSSAPPIPGAIDQTTTDTDRRPPQFSLGTQRLKGSDD